MRTHLPDRRASWQQKGVIGGQPFFVTFGEHKDGRLGEIFINSSREGTFVLGIVGALARMVSIALQCGAQAEDVVKALRHLNFEPNGTVQMDSGTMECTSVPDWIAQLIDRYYVKRAA